MAIINYARKQNDDECKSATLIYVSELFVCVNAHIKSKLCRVFKLNLY